MRWRDRITPRYAPPLAYQSIQFIRAKGRHRRYGVPGTHRLFKQGQAPYIVVGLAAPIFFRTLGTNRIVAQLPSSDDMRFKTHLMGHILHGVGCM